VLRKLTNACSAASGFLSLDPSVTKITRAVAITANLPKPSDRKKKIGVMTWVRNSLAGFWAGFARTQVQPG